MGDPSRVKKSCTQTKRFLEAVTVLHVAISDRVSSGGTGRNVPSTAQHVRSTRIRCQMTVPFVQYISLRKRIGVLYWSVTK